MRTFDHVGIPSVQPQPAEMWVEKTRVWVTDPSSHPQRIEYLRFADDSPVTGPTRHLPHIAFRVDNLEEAMEGTEVLLGPFDATDNLRVVFVQKDGAVFEFMQSTKEGEWFEASNK